MTDFPQNTIKVGYKDIKLEKVQTFFHKENNYGEFDDRKGTIEVNAELEGVELANTLFHELLHATAWVGGLSTGDTPVMDEKKEEYVVNILTNQMMSVFRDNPWILSFIQECLKKENLAITTNEE